MSYYLNTFRSANTIRVTVPRGLRHELSLLAGDILYVKILRRGVGEITALDPNGKPKVNKK